MTKDQLHQLSTCLLGEVRYIVEASDPYQAADHIDWMTLGAKHMAQVLGLQDIADMLTKARIMHAAALAYATGRSYMV